MKYTILATIALMGLAAVSQAPEIYTSLPTYPPNSEIQQLTRGPVPGAAARERAPRLSQFEMIENHPPKLELMVRMPCGSRLTRADLIGMAQDKKPNGDRLVTYQKPGRDVEIWIVATTRVWQRTLELKAEGGKYRVRDNNIRDEVDWHVTRLTNPQTGSSCLNEEQLTRNDIWNMAHAGLLRIQRTQRKPAS